MVRLNSLPEIQVSDEIESVIRKTAEKTLLMERNEDCEVSIFLTDDVEIQKLNKLYRNVDKPTDVLAFAMREGIDGNLNRQILGDVVISIPTAQRQANTYGHSIYAEISLLVAHGILHLLGYEHEKEHEAEVMWQKQSDVLYSLNYNLAEQG